MGVCMFSFQTAWSCKLSSTFFSIRIRAAAIVQIEKKERRGVHARDFFLPPLIKTGSGGSHAPPLQHGRKKKGAKIAFPQLTIASRQMWHGHPTPYRRTAAAVVSIGLLLRQKVENCKDNGYLKMGPCNSPSKIGIETNLSCQVSLPKYGH